MKFKRRLFIYLILFVPTSTIVLDYFGRIDFLKMTITNLIQKNISVENRRKVKKYFLPYREIDILQKRFDETKAENINYREVIKYLSPIALENDLRIRDKLLDLEFKKSSKTNTFSFARGDTNYTFSVEKFIPSKNVLLRGIKNSLPLSGYIDKNENRLFLLSSIGILGYSKLKNNSLDFKQIKNNLNKFIGEKQFKKEGLDHAEISKTLPFSVKDLFISNNKIFISFTNEISEDCWNTSVVVADLDYKQVNFEPLFFPKECVNSLNNPDNVFLAHQSGGRIVKYDGDHIVLSTGDYRNRYLAQDKKSTFGKILKININTKNYEVLAMGSRNIQGLYHDKLNDLIVFTDHGPRGGDEINILLKKMLSDKEIPNYGWAVSSYGFHYKNTPETKKYPLHKSHEKYGFIEPTKYFNPSIGPSEIIGLDPNNKLYLLSSLKARSIYLMKLNNENKIIQFDNFKINERVRDMILFNEKIYLFLEDTGSIGVINLKELNP